MTLRNLCAGAVAVILIGAAHGCSSDETTPASSSSGTSSGGGHGGASGALSLSLPQSTDGAMLANPTVYSEISLQVVTEGTATAVEVTIGQTSVSASDNGDGTWTALLPIGGLPDSTVTVEARGETLSGTQATIAADLVLSDAGVQLTAFDEVGSAGTPRIHRHNGSVWLTWTDRFEPDAESWARRIDGGGRWIGDRIRLIGSSEETLYARTAFGNEGIGVIYQQHGGPYTTHFKIVDFDGNELLAPIDLVPTNAYGSFGGDITFDGQAFVAVWRTNDGSGGGEVRWIRVDEGSGTVTGPVMVAASGNDDPAGGFEPFSFVSVEQVGEVSLVSFVRDHWDNALAMAIPKSQLATVTLDGTVSHQFLGAEASWTYHREARVFPIGGEVTAIWSAVDLTSSDPDPPNLFLGARSDSTGVMAIDDDGALVVDGVDDRDEPFLTDHPTHYGVLAWLDHRAYTLEPNNGRIELYAAPVNDQLVSGESVVFPHARFVAGLAQLHGLTVGTNVMLLWIDERHGSGIMDPKPEMWLETVWY